ncbi:hypothetical protein [Dethiosulfatarculus sandiegensis]|nr:hypothetical protein [Dethiosulfatarculus sandiegensis]
MGKILNVGCMRTMDDVCTGCSRCMVAIIRRVGGERQNKQEAELMAS